MTLIIAERNNKHLSFSSDSRISFGTHGFFDKGIKIFSVPFKLKGPATKKEDLGHYEFEHTYGMAIVGSSTNANTVKDSIAELLPYTTYLTNMSDFSIPSLGSIVFKIYKEISEEITLIMGANGLCEIIFGGFCLHQGRIRVLRFFFTVTGDKVEYNYEEILQENNMLFFGSGKEVAAEIWNADRTLEPLQILKKVIMLEKDKKVGGALQFGAFYDKDFKVSGVIEKEVDQNGFLIKSSKYRRGFLVEDELKQLNQPPYLAFSYGYRPVNIKIEDEPKKE
ncbi:MAG: hypothetical protein ACJ77K_17585 [Bacteroidia bacterium]